MEDEKRFMPEQKDTMRRAEEAVKEVAARHEEELRALIAEQGGGAIIEPMREGRVTAEQLAQEFEELAQERNIDLSDFYQRAGSWSPFGHRHEVTTFYQIVLQHLRQERDKKETQ